MGNKRKVVQNVADFLIRASDLYGRMKSEEFSQDKFTQIIEGYATQSPIEDMFYIAICAMSEALYMPINPDPVFNEKKQVWQIGHGLHISTQAKVGKYKVDFLISSTDGPQPNEVIVELDGHEFHDKDKYQRAYEKARDRFLIKEGFRVFHYTGSEIFSDPFAAAHEALAFLGATNEEYEPGNPLGVE